MITLFSTLGGLSTLTVCLTNIINKLFNIQISGLKVLISWIISILLSIFGLIFGLGLFLDYGTIYEINAWVYTILTGIGLGFISNGIYDIKYVITLIDFIKLLKINK